MQSLATFIAFDLLPELSSLCISPNNLYLCRDKVAACAKHYVGDGGTINGINEGNTLASWDELLRIHMPAYYDSISKGVATVMISFSSWNGVKMHANRFLITDFLKNTLNFTVSPIFLCNLIFFCFLLRKGQVCSKGL